MVRSPRSTISSPQQAAAGLAGLVCLACASVAPVDAPATSGLLAKADLDAPARTVTVTWRYNVDGDFGRPPDARIDEVFSTEFVPTCVEYRPPDTLYVAGSASGSTRIEAWTLRAPRIVVGPAPGASELVPRGRVRAAPILEVPNAPAGPVRTIFWNRGKERSLFLRYVQSPDVHELTWRAGELGRTTVALSAAEQPALSTSGYDAFLAGDHSTAGYVYGFHARDRLDLQPSVILFDVDRDGTLDAHEVCGFTELEARGLKDPRLWIEIQGERVRG